MKLKDSTSAAARAVRKSILNGELDHVQLDLLERLRVRLIGIFYTEVGPEWSSCGKQETDYLHHIDLTLTGHRQVVFRGEGVYLAKQIDLWRKATGRATGFPVHVCYLASPEFIQKNPSFSADLNAAQKDAVDLWYGKPERAIDIVTEVTRLPKDVIAVAYKETVRMLSGLAEEQIETLIVQLKLNKEFGFLKSDLWDNPDRIRREFFHRA